MKSRDDDRRGGRDWRDEPRRDWRGREQGQQEAFQGRSTQMGGSDYGGRDAGWGQDPGRDVRERERPASSRDESRRRHGDDYERGYWGNDFDRGDMGASDDGRAFHPRDSWRTHDPGSRLGRSGALGGGDRARGAFGDYGDDARDDWNLPNGPRTWGSGVGSGMQGRGMREGRHSDPDYQQWRDEQLERFDEDFDAFRRERYGKFAEEFNTWRSQRANLKPSSESSGAATAGSSGPQGGTSPSATAAGGSRSGDPSTSTPTSQQHG
jgi:hypothetical protein